MKDGTYRYVQDSMRPLEYTIIVKNGVVTDAYVDQVLGNYRSSGGWERSMIGKSVDELDLSEYKKIR